MTSEPLFFFNKQSRQYYSKQKFNCSVCEREITHLMHLFQTTNKHGDIGYDWFCIQCWQNKDEIRRRIPRMNAYELSKVVILTSKIPAGSILVRLERISLVPKKDSITCFEAAELKSVYVKDNTKLAGRESLEGAQIGNANVPMPQISDFTVSEWLDQESKATPLLPETKLRLLQ